MSGLNPEKNDVNISRLFHWGQEFEIVDRYLKPITKVYIRLIGDAEVNKSRVFAIRKSAELRKALRTEGTDERIAFISSIFDIEDTNDLVELISMLYYRKFIQEATKAVKIPMPKEPKSDSPLEDFEKFQAEVDEYPEKRNQAIMDYTIALLEEKKAELASKSIDELKKIYEREMINELCEREMVEAFKDISTYYGLYSDPDFKVRAFENFEDFNNLPTEIKQQYIDNYQGLEINIDELKKLQEAMR